MAQIGHFGAVKFYVSLKGGRPDILSFSDANWRSSINVEEHRRQGKKPILEVVDRNSDEFTMNVYVSAFQQQSPMMIVEELRKYCLYFKEYPLSIGGKRIGSHKFIIIDVSNDMKKFYKNGKLLVVEISVTFKESPKLKKKSKKKKKSKSKKKAAKSAKKAKGKMTGKVTGVKRLEDGSVAAKRRGYSIYTAGKNTSLWAIAKEVYRDGSKYKKIYNANKTKSKEFHRLTSISETIQKGWRLKIPT